MKRRWQMATKPRTLAAAAAILVSLALRVPAHSQVIGSYDLNGQFELGKFIGAHMNAYEVR
jgi:hypothetical protein